MGNFVEENMDDLFFSVVSKFLIPLDVSVIINNTTDIFHGTPTIIWHKYLIKLFKCKISTKKIFIKANGSFGGMKPLLFLFISVIE
jgi:hypothetical protein